MVHAAGGQQRGNRHQLGVHAAIGKNQDRDAVGDRAARLRAAARPAGAACPAAPSLRGNSIDSVRLLKPGRVELPDLLQLGVGQDRLLEPQQPALLGRFVEQVAFASRSW